VKISSQTTSNFSLIRHLKCSHTQKDLDNFNEIVKKNKASAKTMTKSASSLKKIGFKKQGHDSFMDQWMLFPFMNTWLLVPFMNNNFYTIVNTYMPCSSMYCTCIPSLLFSTIPILQSVQNSAKVCENEQMCDRTSHTLKSAARTHTARTHTARTLKNVFRTHMCECARTCAIFFSQLTVC
jgi:hypothetical protein